MGALAIAAVGTAGLRMARNGADIVDAIRRGTGITVEVISGQEEGRLAYVAVQAGRSIGKGSIVVFDTGGGSSQFTFGQDSQVDGAMERRRRGGPLHRTLRAERRRHRGRSRQGRRGDLRRPLRRIDGRRSPTRSSALGGAVTNIAAVKHGLATYDPNVCRAR